MLATILQNYPELRATLVDLPDTVERGRERLVASGMDARCAFVGQSFFDALPIGGDVYVLNSVLHDWNDMDGGAILLRCRAAAGDRGRVVILEDSGDESGDRTGFAEMNLRMLVLYGGREGAGMKILGVTLRVENLLRSVKFYRNILGFSVEQDTGRAVVHAWLIERVAHFV